MLAGEDVAQLDVQYTVDDYNIKTTNKTNNNNTEKN
jgi:hypothetical protein